MSSMVSGVFGPSKSEKRAMREMEQQQAEQQAELDAEKARLKRAEDGRNKLRSSRRGLLAFLDDVPGLSTMLGGGNTDVAAPRRKGRTYE